MISAGRGESGVEEGDKNKDDREDRGGLGSSGGGTGSLLEARGVALWS